MENFLRLARHAEYVMRLHQELLGVQKTDMARHPVAENLATAPLRITHHVPKQTTETYKNKIRQYLCKVCSALSERESRSTETRFYCEECTRVFGGRVALCTKIQHGQSLTCSQIWHETWKNGTMIPPELRKRIRFRKMRSEDD